jgi:hypothetical protein
MFGTRQGLHHTQAPLLTHRALLDVHPGHSSHEVLRTFLRLWVGRGMCSAALACASWVPLVLAQHPAGRDRTAKGSGTPSKGYFGGLIEKCSRSDSNARSQPPVAAFDFLFPLNWVFSAFDENTPSSENVKRTGWRSFPARCHVTGGAVTQNRKDRHNLACLRLKS